MLIREPSGNEDESLIRPYSNLQHMTTIEKTLFTIVMTILAILFILLNIWIVVEFI